MWYLLNQLFSLFKDTNLTWYTNKPDLTECFQKTILVWVPCIFLWIFSTMEAYYLLNSKRRNIPCTWLFISKQVLTIGLIILCIIDLGTTIYKSTYEEVYNVDYYTPCIQIITFVSVTVFCNLFSSTLWFYSALFLIKWKHKCHEFIVIWRKHLLNYI